MAAIIFHEPVFSTVVESGDKLYFYAVGTTTDYTDVYTDFALTTNPAQPVIADSDGRFSVLYVDGAAADFKAVLHDSNDVEKWTCERYPIDDITSTAADLVIAEADIVTLQGQVTTVESEIDTLQTESADYETRINLLEVADTSGFVETTDFTDNQSLGSNGHQIFPGGLIMNWGEVSVSNDSTSAVTWDEPFTVACYQAYALMGSDGGAAGGDYIRIDTLSTTGATVYNPAGGTATIRFLALGK